MEFVCQIDTGWLDIVYIDGIEWLKCRICGNMTKRIKREVSPAKGEK